MKIKIFGDSHVKTIFMGWECLQNKGSAPDWHPDFYASHGRYWSNCKVTETDTNFRLSQRAGGLQQLDDYVVQKSNDFYLFSSPLHSSPLYRNRVWRTCCPWTCVHESPDLQALSSTVIQRWIDKQVRHRVELLDRLRAGGVSVAVVEPPKPLKRTPRMFGVRAAVLSAASKLYRDYVRALLEARGIPIIYAPKSTYEETGFTKSTFASGNHDDYHHGNVRFGCEMVKEIANFVGQ